MTWRNYIPQVRLPDFLRISNYLKRKNPKAAETPNVENEPDKKDAELAVQPARDLTKYIRAEVAGEPTNGIVTLRLETPYTFRFSKDEPARSFSDYLCPVGSINGKSGKLMVPRRHLAKYARAQYNIDNSFGLNSGEDSLPEGIVVEEGGVDLEKLANGPPVDKAVKN